MSVSSILVIADPVTVTESMLDTDVPETDYAAHNTATVYLDGDRVINDHSVWESLIGSSSDVTITLGKTKTPFTLGTTADSTPINWTAHGLFNGDKVFFTTTGVLPTPLVPYKLYYVIYYTADSFFISEKPGVALADIAGNALSLSDPQSGTHTAYTRSFISWPQALVDDGQGGVVLTPHGWPQQTPFAVSTTGSLPTGMSPGTVYYVQDPTVDGFYPASDTVGTPLTLTGTQSGTHTARASTNSNRTPTDASTVWVKVSPTNAYKPLDVNPSTRAVLQQIPESLVTISIASPGVVSHPGHNFTDGTLIGLEQHGTLPTPLLDFWSYGATYYVKNANIGAGTYQLSATNGGAAINTSGSTSGSIYVVPLSARWDITPGEEITGAFLDSLSACASVRCHVIDGASTVYDTTINVSGKTQAIFDDLPAGHATATIRIEVYADPTAQDSGGIKAQIGVIGIGTAFTFGLGAELGAKLQHQSFSRMENNAFGDDILAVRGRARKVTFTTHVTRATFDNVWATLSGLDAIPCMYRLTKGYESMNVYGYFLSLDGDFDMQTLAQVQLVLKSMSTVRTS